MDKNTSLIPSAEPNSSVQKDGTRSLRGQVAGVVMAGLLVSVTPSKGAQAGAVVYTPGTPVALSGQGSVIPQGINTELSTGITTLGNTGGTFLGLAELETRTYDFFLELIDSTTGELSPFGIDFTESAYFGSEDGYDLYKLTTAAGTSMAFYFNPTTNDVFLQSQLIPLDRITAAVPEPSSIALITAGLLGVFARLRKQKAEAK